MIRVGVLSRDEDVHGISGTGHPAEIVEFSDGSVVVRWLGKDASTNCTTGVKNVTNVHGHAGKSEITWLWEQEQEADPMEAVFQRKIAEAGGATAPTGAAKPKKEDSSAEEEAEAIADEIVAGAAEQAERVSEKVAEKLSATIAEKVAEKAAEKLTEENGAEE
jgi:hypothetical protein